MKTATQMKVVHESETQRQHARLPVPARVEIEGKEYVVRNISAAGLSVQGISGNFVRGQNLRLRLRISFGEFLLEMKTESNLRYCDPPRKIIGCSFTNLSRQQISLLNHVLKAFLAGDSILPGDVLNIAARNNFSRPRQQAEMAANQPSLWRQLPGLLAVSAVGFLIISFVAGNLYSSLFLVRSSSAAIAGPVMEIKASAEGIYHSQIDPGSATIRQNQAIGTITPPGSRAMPVTIASPCNCYIVKTSAFEGQYLPPGAPLLTLVPVDAKPWVTAELDPGQAPKIKANTPATIRIFGSGVEYTGHIASVESSMLQPGQANGNRSVMMQITADQKIPVDLINRPASISFRLHDFSLPKFDFSGISLSNLPLPAFLKE